MSILPTRLELQRLTIWMGVAAVITAALSFVGLPLWVTVWHSLTMASAAVWEKWGPVAIEAEVKRDG